jgi:phosphoglycerate kinase
MKTIKDIPLTGKKVLIRVDFNVPLDQDRNVTDDTRVKGSLPTIDYALKQGCKVILASHLGRPDGKPDKKYSLAPAARCLETHLGRPVKLAPDCIGPEAVAMADRMNAGDVILLENLRFHPGEEKNADDFAEQLASLCDVYVNDAFAVSHRDNASVSAITRFAPRSVAGFLLDKEIDYFNQAMTHPQRPLAVVLGGAKVSGKLAAIENILLRVDKIIIGGAMANTFLAAGGFAMGKSKIEADLIGTAGDIMTKAADRGVRFYLPVDVVAADRFAEDARLKTVPVGEMPEDWMALDIGPASVLLFKEAIADARTIVWNGPMGAFEMPPFSQGTLAMVDALAESNALTIVGGGDTDVAVHMTDKAEKITYISTGGGAFLELLEGKKLPGVVALEQTEK